MSKKPKLYYVSTGMGCGIRAGHSIEGVRKEELRSAGSYAGVKEVRMATKADVAWVKGMGGGIPEIK